MFVAQVLFDFFVNHRQKQGGVGGRRRKVFPVLMLRKMRKFRRVATSELAHYLHHIAEVHGLAFVEVEPCFGLQQQHYFFDNLGIETLDGEQKKVIGAWGKPFEADFVPGGFQKWMWLKERLISLPA